MITRTVSKWNKKTKKYDHIETEESFDTCHFIPISRETAIRQNEKDITILVKKEGIELILLTIPKEDWDKFVNMCNWVNNEMKKENNGDN